MIKILKAIWDRLFPVREYCDICDAKLPKDDRIGGVCHRCNIPG